MRRLWVALWLMSVGCGRGEVPGPEREATAQPQRPSTPVVPSSRPLPVIFSGCAVPGPGPACGLGSEERRLTLWVDEPSPDAIGVSIDGEPVARPGVSVEQGLRWTLSIPEGAARLEVRRRDLDDTVFSLALWTVAQAEIDDADALGREAKRASDAGRLEVLQEIVERARGRRHWSVAARWAHSLTWHLIRERDLSRGRRWLEEAGAMLPYEDATHLYYRGLLAETRGDLGEALVAYRRALHQARALGAGLKPVLMLAVLGRTAVLLARAGDRAGTLETLEHALPLAGSEEIDDAIRASFLDSAAWALLVLGSSSGRPRALLDQARELLGDEPRGRDAWFTVRLNLAYDALEHGDTIAARRWLETLEGRRLIRTNELWYRLLLARLERLEGTPESAGRRLRAMIADADRLRDHSLRWAARVEHARALEQLERRPEALAEYAEADLVLEQQLPLLGMGDRERFVVGRDAVARRRVELLLDQGEPEAALCVARLARTRALRSLDQRVRRDADPTTRRALDEYLGTRLRLDEAYDGTFMIASIARADRRRRELEREREANEQRFEAIMRGPGGGRSAPPDCDALSRPVAGTVDLHYVELERGWIGFAADGEGKVVLRALSDPSEALESGDSDRLGAILLDPFEETVTAASRVRVMATGPLFGVAFHALPSGGEGRRLQDERVVVYGLDLPRARESGDGTGPALVLEPPSNLPRAHEEAELGASGLRRRGATVLWLDDDASAVDGGPLSVRLLAELPRASWLHYVGHARSDGLGGWDSELVLAADGTAALGVADVLALPRVPPVVVLSGCQTGVVDPRSRSGGMSLAHAFLLAGAEIVVATTEEVRDDEAIALMRDLYGVLDGLDAHALSRAVAEAQRRARAVVRDEREREPAWRSIRAWVP
ncbi:MAG: CHAT domain-containing protein [Myxococcales bacterium]|nr:CHAT domain-containing protein [Myxococcales bacterium]